MCVATLLLLYYTHSVFVYCMCSVIPSLCQWIMKFQRGCTWTLICMNVCIYVKCLWNMFFTYTFTRCNNTRMRTHTHCNTVTSRLQFALIQFALGSCRSLSNDYSHHLIGTTQIQPTPTVGRFDSPLSLLFKVCLRKVTVNPINICMKTSGIHTAVHCVYEYTFGVLKHRYWTWTEAPWNSGQTVNFSVYYRPTATLICCGHEDTPL